jgi:hypothetical protein
MRDPNGVVNGLVLHQNGDRRAPKLSVSEVPPEPQEIAFDAATSGGVAGRYRFDTGDVLDVALRAIISKHSSRDKARLPIFASGKDKFFYKIVDAQLDFERDGGGKVLAAVLHQNGRDQRAPRISTLMKLA